MDSTTSRPRPQQEGFAFEGEPGQRVPAEEAKSRVSSDPNLYPAEPLKGFANDVSGRRAVPQPAQPVWVRRVWLVIYVMFCLELGMLLAVLPWTQVWTNNTLVAHLPALRSLLHHHFVRGLATGMGIIDIWLGVSEAVNYRERK